MDEKFYEDIYKINLETTQYGKVFQKLIAKDGFSNNIIENYNNEVLVNMKKVIEDTIIPTQYGNLMFKNVIFEKAKIPGSSKMTDLTPKMAREKLTPYFSDIYVDIVHSPIQKPIAFIGDKPIYGPKVEVDDIFYKQKLGSIPIMLGSKICHLYDKTPEERYQMGECFNDPLGYFFIRSERVINNQENLRLSTFLIYQATKDPKCSVKGVITCPTKQGTRITNLVICKHSTLNVTLHHIKLGQEPLNIFIVYRILGMKINDAIKQILSFCDKEDHFKIKNKLAPTIAAYKIIAEEDEDLENLKNRILEIRKSNSKSNLLLQVDRVTKDIEDDLLSNIEGNERKMLHLSMYASRMAEYMIGKRSLDDRDNFANKRIATPGRSLYFLFKSIWADFVKEITNKVSDSNIKSATQISHLIKPANIREQLIKAFGPNAWGVKRSYRKDNITESLKRDTPLAVFSQIGRIITPSSRQSKNSAVRMPHPSQICFICCFETPEGEGLGLVKNLAVSCYISLERDPQIIIEILRDPNLKDYIYINKDEDDMIPITVNGIIEGWTSEEDNVVKFLKYYKSQGIIDKDVCIFNNIRDKCVEIYCDSGRPCRPVFVVDEKTCEINIDKLNMWNAEIDELIKSNCIEYIDAREQEWLYMAETIDKVEDRRKVLLELQNHKEGSERYNELIILLNETIPYSHCEIDPSAMLSIAGNLIPQANRQAGPRTSYQCSMGRQALTQYHSNEHLRFDASYKMVHYPTKTLFQNDLQETAGLNSMSNGQTVQVAILAHPDNAEDGIVFKEEAIKYGNKLDNAKKFTFAELIKSSNDYTERFAKPPLIPGEPAEKYSAIDEKGIPILDAYIREGDCVIGKIKEFNKAINGSNIGDIKNTSQFAGKGESGYIDRVLIILTNDHQQQMIKVKVRQNRKYIPGDKLASRYSQKGTISRIVPAREMPRVSSGPLKGMVPDILINPHSQPSRMTMNMIIEILSSKAACINGKFYNATTFRDYENDMEEIQQTLTDYGLDPNGYDYFEFPDGTPMKTKVYFGPCYYQALRHHVNDKIQMRARAGLKPSTRQPVSGRSNEGGLKVGEMERDALISHGSSALLRERLMGVSDQYDLPICSNCGTIAITRTDDSIKPNECRLCKDKAKFGIITIPYVLKLLLYYLNAACINFRFKTTEIKYPNNRPIEEQFLV